MQESIVKPSGGQEKSTTKATNYAKLHQYARVDLLPKSHCSGHLGGKRMGQSMSKSNYFIGKCHKNVDFILDTELPLYFNEITYEVLLMKVRGLTQCVTWAESYT